MTKEELLSLPPNVALGVLLDGSAKLQEIVAATEKPKGPLPPRFDRRVFRKGGFCWASEMSIENLTYWLGKKREGAASGSQWAERDAKEVDQLQRWVAYRTWFPHDPWTGTRGDSEVRAAPPSKHPKLHATEPREEPAPAPKPYTYTYDPRAEAYREALNRSPDPPEEDGNEDYGL